MKKTWHLLGLMALSLMLLAVDKGVVFARLTGTNPTSADVWCVGVSGAEVCVDASGNLLPTTDNDTTLGTSSLRWATAYILDITVGDDLTVTDAASITGTLTVTSTTTLNNNLLINNSFKPYARTSTELAVLVPPASGYVLLNITRANLCVSTGATVGAWIHTSTSNLVADWKQCY